MPARLCAIILLALVATTAASAAERPNILWISCENISPHLHCYGDDHAITPTLDRLAESGVRYTHTVTTCPVCATNRSSIITGMYPTTVGRQYMRCQAKLPDQIRCLTEYLREAGYYCTNNSKKDYNFTDAKSAWDESSGKAHWRGRKPGQPLFHVRNFTNTHETQNRPRGQDHVSKTKDLKPSQRQDPAQLPLPAQWLNYAERNETMKALRRLQAL